MAQRFPAMGRGASSSRPNAPSKTLGIGVHVLRPGEPPCMYHRESDQEGFLVIAGECLAIVEGQERRMRTWDYLHCPPETDAHHDRRGRRAVRDPDGRHAHAARDHALPGRAGRSRGTARRSTTADRRRRRRPTPAGRRRSRRARRGRSDHRLEVHDGRPVDRLQRCDAQPARRRPRAPRPRAARSGSAATPSASRRRRAAASVSRRAGARCSASRSPRCSQVRTSRRSPRPRRRGPARNAGVELDPCLRPALAPLLGRRVEVVERRLEHADAPQLERAQWTRRAQIALPQRR